jgi:putative ABC transport system permease protein
VTATRVDRDRAFYSAPDALDYTRGVRALEEIAWFAPWGVNLTGIPDPARVQGVRVTPNVFAVLGVGAAVGRPLEPADANGDGHVYIVVLSHQLWTSRFGSDSSIVGRSLLLNGGAYSVVGVLPREFLFPGQEAALATPLQLDRDPRRNDRGTNFLRMFGRLREGATHQMLVAELGTIARELREKHPEENGKKTEPRVFALEAELLGAFRQMLLIVLGAVTLLLGVACLNVAGLLIVRGVERRGEHAMRLVLGASRATLVRLTFFEAARLSCVGRRRRRARMAGAPRRATRHGRVVAPAS